MANDITQKQNEPASLQHVLDLEWPALKAHKPDCEDVEGLASGAKASELRNWYPASVAPLPLHAGRVVCQRSNCRWDSKLRRYFRMTVVGLAVVLLVGAVATAVIQNLKFEDFVLSLMAPILPIALWGVREGYAQVEAAERAGRLKEFGNKLWESTLQGQLAPDLATAQSRRFQDELFEHRQRSPVVFDWFYRLFRSRFESQMYHSAEAMVEEARAKGL